MLLTGAVIMSQELYIVNDETMLATAWLALMYGFVKGGGASVAETLDTRAGKIEDELNAAREEQKESVKAMISKADAEITVNQELLTVCNKDSFNEWTTYKMQKTVEGAAIKSSAQTLEKLAAVKRIEEAYQRRKMTALLDELQTAVEEAIAKDANFASASIDEAIPHVAAARPLL